MGQKKPDEMAREKLTAFLRSLPCAVVDFHQPDQQEDCSFREQHEENGLTTPKPADGDACPSGDSTGKD